jgi:S-adenosylmethionine synthetase
MKNVTHIRCSINVKYYGIENTISLPGFSGNDASVIDFTRWYAAEVVAKNPAASDITVTECVTETAGNFTAENTNTYKVA